ncbi:unnamed protein product [Parascedosporium putredinis]|uniref:BAR domain-containing protein n=1 Tax=Parascedosporium putredinis TaxID=1442378 RepID=A0A9P1H563_9PEZI|nr:unnamed protein product [Parascedosporium putredinis]CAI7998934.1 unnamed protein product [Parascedosporium putredinis]
MHGLQRYWERAGVFRGPDYPFCYADPTVHKEQLGQVDDKTQLPPDYIELEKRVDALKQAHQKMLAVTSHYSNEAYDYPPNIKETFQDLGRTVSEKVSLFSEAQEEIEKAEDEFVTQTEEALGVMKNVLDTPEPLRNLAELVTAQAEFHKKAFEILNELVPIIDSLQVEQETTYRQSRDNDL